MYINPVILTCYRGTLLIVVIQVIQTTILNSKPKSFKHNTGSTNTTFMRVSGPSYSHPLLIISVNNITDELTDVAHLYLKIIYYKNNKKRESGGKERLPPFNLFL